MNWFSIFIVSVIALVLSLSLWMRLIKVLDQNGIAYTPIVKRKILWEILFQIARLLVLFSVVHWGLSYLQQP
jgi:hypothetical protein